MSDNLRDRIAQAVCQEYFSNTDVVWQTWRESFNADPDYWLNYADAVIRELGLEREDGECRFCHAQLPCGRWVAWDD